MKLTKKEISEIADFLDSGLRCYFNLKTREIKTILNFDSWPDAEEELWEDVLREIEDNRTHYIEFEVMSTHDSFRIMADFTEIVDNRELQERLIHAINKSKPFGNFKWHIDNSGHYRQQWFDYKKMRYIEWVKEQLENYNRTIENE